MATIFIFHGIGGSPEGNWFPWMKTELEKSRHLVIVPRFPNTDAPLLDEWLELMEKYHESIDENSIFVGHSLGSMFALRLLERAESPIRATFLVASVCGTDDGLEYKPLMTTFTEAPLDIDAIRTNTNEIQMIHGDNDPYIVLPHAETMAKNLHAKLIVIAGGGHLGAGAGFSEFPKLRDLILAGSIRR